MSKTSMRDRMPVVAAFVDSLREVFGREEIDNVIRRGLRSSAEPEHRVAFSENGVTLGQRASEPVQSVTLAEMVIGPALTLPTKRGRR